jgi:tetratricopeptide (TPR) repeat protein
MGIFDSFKKKKPEEGSGELKPQTPPRREQAAPGRWQVGYRIQNRYEIHHILGGPGKSGMGIVYICYDHELNEPVAIKTFQEKFLRDRASIDRFKWEAETWVRLEKHYNIVQAKYVDEIEGKPCIFLEYIVGDEQYGADLSSWIYLGGLHRNGKPDIPLILNFAIQFCHGMIHAEKKFQEIKKPFVHRDIKPQNIMVTRDRVVKVTDFGLVKVYAEMEGDIPEITVGEGVHKMLSLSKSGAICGTVPYMSPEQCRGEKEIDIRSDVYAFGCTLYEMLTQKYVFAGDFIYHHLKTIPRSPAVHKGLDGVVMKCLEKRPEHRYRDFSELEKALSSIYLDLTGEEVKEPEATALEAWELSDKGLSLAHLRLHQEAITCCREALKINSNHVRAHNNLGIAYSAQGKLDEAVREYREALRIDPNYADAHINLGNAYCDQGKLDEAVREYREALRINPNYDYAHRNLGNAYEAQGKLDEAVREYREALRINPNDTEAHTNLGNAYCDQGKLDEAVKEYREALRINLNDDYAHLNLGIAYGAQGKLDEAVREYREALRINPNYDATHLNLGNAYEAQGKLDEAIECYQRFIRLASPQSASYVRQVEETIRELKAKI